MTESEQLHTILAVAYEAQQHRDTISPASLATTVMERIGFPQSLHVLGYAGCHLHLRQMARSFCRAKYAVEEAATQNGELFEVALQRRYPVAPKDGTDPEYKLLEKLTAEDIAYNVDRLTIAGDGYLKHAKLLRKYGEDRNQPS